MKFNHNSYTGQTNETNQTNQMNTIDLTNQTNVDTSIPHHKTVERKSKRTRASNPTTHPSPHKRKLVLTLSLGVLLATTAGLSLTSTYAIAASMSANAATSTSLSTAKTTSSPATSSTSNTALVDPTINTVIQTQTQVYEGKHFRFYYPPAWKTGIQSTIYHPPGMDSSEVVDFSYNDQSVLTLMAIPRAAWNAQLPDEVPYGDRIAANGNYIYAINLPQDSVYDPKSKEYPPFHKRVLTMDQVKLMFQGK